MGRSSIADYALQVALAYELEQALTIAFDVIATEDAAWLSLQGTAKRQLSIRERQMPLVLAIQPEHIERAVRRLSAAE